MLRRSRELASASKPHSSTGTLACGCDATSCHRTRRRATSCRAGRAMYVSVNKAACTSPQVARGRRPGGEPRALPPLAQSRGLAHDDDPPAVAVAEHADGQVDDRRGARRDLARRRLVRVRRRPPSDGAAVLGLAVEAAAARAVVVGRRVRRGGVVPARAGRAATRWSRTSCASSARSPRTPSSASSAIATSRPSTGCWPSTGWTTRGSTRRPRSRSCWRTSSATCARRAGRASRLTLARANETPLKPIPSLFTPEVLEAAQRALPRGLRGVRLRRPAARRASTRPTPTTRPRSPRSAA